MSDLKGFVRADGADFLVGAEVKPNKAKDERYYYHPPVARVSIGGKSLYIITDDYEGCAILDIEALPYLRLALGRLDRRLKKARQQ